MSSKHMLIESFYFKSCFYIPKCHLLYSKEQISWRKKFENRCRLVVRSVENLERAVLVLTLRVLHWVLAWFLCCYVLLVVVNIYVASDLHMRCYFGGSCSK